MGVKSERESENKEKMIKKENRRQEFDKQKRK
jgi:hypothetical protein